MRGSNDHDGGAILAQQGIKVAPAGACACIARDGAAPEWERKGGLQARGCGLAHPATLRLHGWPTRRRALIATAPIAH